MRWVGWEAGRALAWHGRKVDGGQNDQCHVSVSIKQQGRYLYYTRFTHLPACTHTATLTTSACHHTLPSLTSPHLTSSALTTPHLPLPAAHPYCLPHHLPAFTLPLPPPLPGLAGREAGEEAWYFWGKHVGEKLSVGVVTGFTGRLGVRRHEYLGKARRQEEAAFPPLHACTPPLPAPLPPPPSSTVTGKEGGAGKSHLTYCLPLPYHPATTAYLPLTLPSSCHACDSDGV